MTGYSDRLFALVAAVTLLACQPNDRSGIDAVDGFGGETGDGSAGQGGGTLELDEPLAFGVVASDYTATSIALLGPDGSMLARDFIHSGSASAGLVTALSGDVVLPTHSGDPRTLTVIDRFRTDVITRVDPGSGRVLGQLKTHRTPEQGVALSSNPQDYVQLGERDAWVSRFEPNPAVPVDDPDRGTDLLQVDPSDFTRGRRIGLSHLDTVDPDGVTVLARPSTMVHVGDRIVVGIVDLSRGFDAAGEGMVALVDPDAESAERVALPGLTNCGQVVPVPDDARRVIVACVGFFRGVPRDGAGLAVLRLQDGALELEHLWRGADAPGAPLAVANVVAVGGTEVVAVAEGAESPEADPAAPAHDVAYLVDVATGSQHEIFEAAGRYVIGSGAFNARRGLLLIPDASTDAADRPVAGIRLYERDADGVFQAREVVEVGEVLPARQVRPL